VRGRWAARYNKPGGSGGGGRSSGGSGGRDGSPNSFLLALEGNTPGIQKAGFLGPKHLSETGGLGGLSHSCGFHDDHDIRVSDGGGYN
jgi:hypothetical protein